MLIRFFIQFSNQIFVYLSSKYLIECMRNISMWLLRPKVEYQAYKHSQQYGEKNGNLDEEADSWFFMFLAVVLWGRCACLKSLHILCLLDTQVRYAANKY